MKRKRKRKRKKKRKRDEVEKRSEGWGQEGLQGLQGLAEGGLGGKGVQDVGREALLLLPNSEATQSTYKSYLYTNITPVALDDSSSSGPPEAMKRMEGGETGGSI